MKDCGCKAWKENIPKINGVLQIHQIRTGEGYDGEPFKYCPWCGKKCGQPKEEE